MAEKSKVRVYGRSLAGIAGSNPVGVGMSVSAMGRFLVQRSPTDCGVSNWMRLGKPQLEEI